MAYPGRSNIYEGTIRKMVTQALEARDEEFRKEHGADADTKLLAYLRLCAGKLQHVPWPGEILGGTVIAERFGSWEKALAAAGLPRPQGENDQRNFQRYRQEEARQKEIYRQRKAERKLLAQKRRVQQEAKRRNAEKNKPKE